MGELLELLFPSEKTVEWTSVIKNTFNGIPLFSSSYYCAQNMKIILGAKEDNDLRARKILARAIALHIEEPSLIVPIPSSPRANRSRGYDHSALLAKEVAKLTGGVIGQILKVNRKIKDQTRLDSASRFINLSGAYSLIAGNYPGERVVLIDDLVTTGASMLEAIRVLGGAGLTPNRAVSACIATHHLPNTIST